MLPCLMKPECTHVPRHSKDMEGADGAAGRLKDLLEVGDWSFLRSHGPSKQMTNVMIDLLKIVTVFSVAMLDKQRKGIATIYMRLYIYIYIHIHIYIYTYHHCYH